jgi:tetratricopeptide (TPR) repeat protein
MRVGDHFNAKESLSQGLGGSILQVNEVPGKVVGCASLISTMINVKKHEDALRTISMHESNLALYKNKGDQRSEANCLFQLGLANLEIEQLQQASECFSSCYQLRMLSGDKSGLDEALRQKGLAFYACGDVRAAAESLELWVSNRPEGTPPDAAAVRDDVYATCTLGDAYLRLGDVTNAAEVLKRALSLAHAARERSLEAHALMAFGKLYADLWINKRSADHYERAVAICADLVDGASEARCVRALGMLNFARGDAPSAIKCLEEALSVCKRSGLPLVEAECLCAVADLHYAQGDFVQTRAHYERVCKICKEQLNPLGEAGGLWGLSVANMALGESISAIDTLVESLNMRKALGDHKGEIQCLTSLAEAYMSVGKLDTARQVRLRGCFHHTERVHVQCTRSMRSNAPSP